MIDKTKEEIQNFYLNHSNKETADFLGISKSQMLRILSKLQIEKKVPFKKHAAVKDTVNELKNRINIQNFQADCQQLTQKQICIKYGITVRQLNYLKEDLNIGSRLKYIKDYDIDRLELEDYYKGHTLQDTAQHFKLNSGANIKNLLKYYNIKPEKRIKETFEEAVARIDKNDLAIYYETHTLAETQAHFDCRLIQKLLRYYKIPYKTKKHETFYDVIARIEQNKFIDDFDKLNIYEIFKKYDIAYTTYRKLIQYYGLGRKSGIFAFQDASLSTCEDSLYKFLCAIIEKEKIIQHDRNVLNGQELDFYIPSKKLAIEFNGNYWHSDLKKEKKYHFNKSKLADSKGIRLIHIWEYE